MQADVQELKIVSDQFAAKYGKPYAQVYYIVSDKKLSTPVI